MEGIELIWKDRVTGQDHRYAYAANESEGDTTARVFGTWREDS